MLMTFWPLLPEQSTFRQKKQDFMSDYVYTN